jgi:flagellar capping protein FliD
MKFVSTDRRAISTGAVVEMEQSVAFGGVSSLDTGNNSLTIIVNGEAKQITFQTLAGDYFDDFEFNSDNTIKDLPAFNDMTGAQRDKALTSFGLNVLNNLGFSTGSLSADNPAGINTFINNLSAGDRARVNTAMDNAIRNDFNGRKANFEAMVRDMYEKERLAAFNSWKDSQGTDHVANFQTIQLERDEITTILAANNISISTFTPGMTDSEFNAEVNRLLTAAPAEDRNKANTEISEARNTKRWESMSLEQQALFDRELARRIAARNQQDYDKALMDAYTAWDRDNQRNATPPIPMQVWNSTTSTWDTNPNYKMFEDWLSDNGFSKDVNDAIAADHWHTDNAILGKAFDASQDSMIQKWAFFNGLYREETAFNNEYEADTSTLYSDFRTEYIRAFQSDAPADDAVTSASLASYFNETMLRQRVGSMTFGSGDGLVNVNVNVTKDANGIITGVNVTAKDRDDGDVALGIFANESSMNDFGFETNKANVSTISTSTRLNELGLTPNPSTGNYHIQINGQSFAFSGTTTIRDMMGTINGNAAAGVTMSFSTLTNTFELKSREFGTASSITIAGDAQGLFGALGIAEGTTANGKNLNLTINGETVETSSDSYEVNGTVITVNSTVEPNTTFSIEVERDNTHLANLIKDFIKDYNDLIDYVYGYVNDKPEKEYYFLTDADREELNLSDTQERRWDERARKGLLYNDRTLIGIMSKMRTDMFSGIDRGDGTLFGLFSMGITTSSDWRQNGKLHIADEAKFMDAINNNLDMVTQLFTRTETGLMAKLNSTIDSAVSRSGERWQRGLLVQRAGIGGGASANDNALYDQIKRLNDIIGNLQFRYDKQQDRYWKIFSALEKQMGQLNGQTDYINQMMGNF